MTAVVERAPATVTSQDVLPSDHPRLPRDRVGILLLNLGTPDATDYRSMRRYLAEFLSDRRVIETSRAIWYPVLYGIILTTRPSRSGANYERIWNREKDESPLRTITRGQAERLADAFRADDRVVVDWAMRYGTPDVESVLAGLIAQGCERILAFPLYPQYAASTTATANDQLYKALMKLRHMPTVRSVPPYYGDPVYIDALARSIERHLATLDFQPEVILASFHGMPEEYVRQGDPYAGQCAETTRLLRARLGLDEQRLRLTFQSRFGPAEWLKPYTDKTVEQLAREGVKRLAVVTPGFAADCLETLEEIAMENAGIFRAAGGEAFAAIPCLNDSEDGLRVIAAVVRRELSGWL
ncbi:MAG: ferrochelatase [Pseudolabrys sp.]|nr:ferrochelatase [Pseudolabrys sp.]